MLARDGDGQVEHVALAHVVLVLDARVVAELDVGEVLEEKINVRMLLLAQAVQRLAPLLGAELLRLLDERAGRLRELMADQLDLGRVRVMFGLGFGFGLGLGLRLGVRVEVRS